MEKEDQTKLEPADLYSQKHVFQNIFHWFEMTWEMMMKKKEKKNLGGGELYLEHSFYVGHHTRQYKVCIHI